MTYFNKEKLTDLIVQAIKGHDKNPEVPQSCYLDSDGVLKYTKSLVKKMSGIKSRRVQLNK